MSLQNWYEYYRQNRPDLSQLRASGEQKTISSGINMLPQAAIYRDLSVQEIIEGEFTKQYHPFEHPALHGAVKLFEHATTGLSADATCRYAEHCCVTMGATGAVSALFEYISANKTDSSLLFLGYHYVLFSNMVSRYHCSANVLDSTEKNKNLPEISQIEVAMENAGYDYVFLTMPANPSGEVYSKEEFRRLIQLCKTRGAPLVLDKCQWDDVIMYNSEEYYRFSKIAIEEDAVDYLIVIHSFSKIRSIPGLRFGYICGPADLVEFTRYYGEMISCMNNFTYIIPLIVDLFYQTISIQPAEHHAMYKKRFRQMLIQRLGVKETTNLLLAAINSKTLQEDFARYAEQLCANKYKTYSHYFKIRNLFSDMPEVSMTKLQGGINFCLICKNPRNISQKQIKKEILETLRFRILTQEDFLHSKQRQDVWFRITCAAHDDIQIYMAQLKDYLQRLIN